MKTNFILLISALFLLLLMGAGCEKNPEDRGNSQNKKDITETIARHFKGVQGFSHFVYH